MTVAALRILRPSGLVLPLFLGGVSEATHTALPRWNSKRTNDGSVQSWDGSRNGNAEYSGAQLADWDVVGLAMLFPLNPSFPPDACSAALPPEAAYNCSNF